MVRRLAILASLLLLARPVSAQTGIDAVENLFGATNVNALTGHGGLSVGVSRDGDLTVMSWPSPSYVDQLGYISSNALDARETPRFGAPEGAGMFLGLLVDRGGSREVHWLRGPSFDATQSYGPDDGANVHTRFTSAELMLEVLLVDAVDPEAAALVRQVQVERAAGSPVDAAWLLTYANLSPQPTTSRLPELPVVDWAADGRNDFGAIWDASRDAVVAFHPSDQRIYDEPTDLIGNPFVDFGPLGAAMVAGTPSAADVATVVSGLDTSYAEGAYVVMTTSPPPEQHQVGFDATPFCDMADALIDNIGQLDVVFPGFTLPLGEDLLEQLRCDREMTPFVEREGWTHTATDAWEDAADGELSGSDIAAGETNEALRTPLAFDAAGVAEASVVLAIGETLAAARGVLPTAPDEVAGRATAALDAWLAGLRVPGEGEVRAVARRSLINVRVGTDASTGAIVASIARQPPYGLDWPRDGAFFNVMLDISGQSELVTERQALYAAWQRADAVRPTPLVDPDPPPVPGGGRGRTYPADAWEMNYYADGMVGGTFRFEIDTTAFAIWTAVAHVGWLPEAEVEPYLRSRWDMISRGCELLVYWRDPETGLHAPAQEDDAAAYTQTLQGAETVFAALELSARAARLLGETEVALRWEDRAAEIRDATMIHLYDAEMMAFERDVSGRAPFQASGRVPTGPTAWLAWPCYVLPFDDPRLDGELRRDLDIVGRTIRLESLGGAYFLKNAISLELARGADPELGPMIDGFVASVAAHATPGTRQYGETMVVVDEGGTPRADQRVANPHLWEGTLFYLAAIAEEDPAELSRWNDVLPASEVPAEGERVPPPPPGAEPPEPTDGDCACRAGARRGGAPWGLGLILLVTLVRRARRPV